MCDRNVPTRSKDKVINNNKIQHFYIVPYSRTPLIRPPSESHWCGHIRGMVVREGFGIFSGAHLLGLHTAMHNSSVHTENGFRGVPVSVAYRGKVSDQATTMFSGTSARSPFNTERRRPTLATFPKTRIQKTSFKYWHPRVACRCHLRFISNLFSTLRNLLNLHLADPKVDDSSQFSLPFYTLFWSWYVMLSFSHARSVVRCKQD